MININSSSFKGLTYIFCERMIFFDYLYDKKRYSFMEISKIMGLSKGEVQGLYNYWLQK